MRAVAVAALLVGVAADAGPLVVTHGPPARASRRLDERVIDGWRAQIDRDTGVPAWLYARDTPIEVPGAVASAAIAEHAARAYLAAHLATLAPGATAADFVLAGDTLDRGVRSVGFRQTWRGLPVLGGELGFAFAGDRLVAIASQARPNVAPSGGARGYAVLPIVRRGAPIEYRFVDVIADREWERYVDPRDHRVEIARVRMIVDATGTLAYDAGVRYGSGPRQAVPAPSVAISANGTGTTTGADGSFSWTGATPATVVPGLSGPYVAIFNQAGALATGSLSAAAGAQTIWSLASDEQGDAQVSTFVYASLAKARARIINPAIASWLDTQLPLYVNEAGGSCNAYETPNDLHFNVSGGGCQNTGRVGDVVYHEFGHALHYHSILAGMGAFDVELSEGLADFTAADLTQDSGIGRGLFLDDTPMRDIDPYGIERHWPDDEYDDPHLAGEIISGALWDTRKNLIASLGQTAGVAQSEVIFAGVMQRAADIPSSFVAALIADDNDGNLANGTPHYCAIQRAFGAHGIADSSYQPTTVSPPTFDGHAITLAVATPPAGGPCPIAHVTAITATWQLGDGVPGSLPLVASSDGLSWSATFPSVPDGTVIAYSLDAALDDGTHVVLPNNPADPMYQAFVGAAQPIWCEHFDRDPMWASTGTVGGEWQWGVPLSAATSGDPQAPYSGLYVYGTQIVGSGRPPSSDAMTTTTLATDVSAFPVVHLQYQRWLVTKDHAETQATIAINGNEVWHNAGDITGGDYHRDREWRFHDLDATPYVADDGTVAITWGLTTGSSRQLGGWTLAEVCLVGLDGPPPCADGGIGPCKEPIIAGGGGCSTSVGAGWGAVLAISAALARARRARSRRASRNTRETRADRRRS